MTELFYIQNLDNSLIESERTQAIQLLETLVPEAEIIEVGSTAIPNVIGKQDLDFMIRVSKTNFNGTRDILDQHLSRNLKQLSNDEFQGYILKSPMDVAVQLLIKDSEHDHFEDFLNALKANQDLVEKYNALKQEWHGKSMNDYRQAKAKFIESVLCNRMLLNEAGTVPARDV